MLFFRSFPPICGHFVFSDDLGWRENGGYCRHLEIWFRERADTQVCPYAGRRAGIAAISNFGGGKGQTHRSPLPKTPKGQDLPAVTSRSCRSVASRSASLTRRMKEMA